MPTSTPSRPDADRQPRPIAEIARELGLGAEEWIPYGHDKAKVRVGALAARRDRPDGKLVVVSSITPTPAGDGKTTMTIGIGQALWRVGARPVIALREPSIGPTLGMKGGGTGGGKSQVVPMEEINLHFTGDFHAITSAHNLLAAAIDNHLHHGNPLGIDVRQVAWKRVLDVNDRALRNVVVGLGGRLDGVPREAGFLITSASEIMAALCLAEDLMDLKQRLGRMLVALTADGKPVTADALGVTGAMAALLRDAIHPNLVQTMEGTPALVHGGPVRQHRPRLQLGAGHPAGAQARRHLPHRGGLRHRPGRREVLRHQVPARGAQARRGHDRGHRAGAQVPRRRAGAGAGPGERGRAHPRARQPGGARGGGAPVQGAGADRDEPLPVGHRGGVRGGAGALRPARAWRCTWPTCSAAGARAARSWPGACSRSWPGSARPSRRSTRSTTPSR